FLNPLAAPRRPAGAAPPGGRAVGGGVAAAGPPPHGLIVELGPGTGPVTRSLIETGVARERLALVEYDPGFCRLLRERFAPAMIVQGDAYALPGTLAKLAGKPMGAVVSSLPLLNQPPERREKLIGDAFALMGPSGLFVQFTYGLQSPIPPEVCANRYVAVRSRPILLNLPPARVWTYRLEGHAAEGRGIERSLAPRK